ncbi:MAG: HMA2 domain-containing protein [Thermodesulfobacteriota bacterium]
MGYYKHHVPGRLRIRSPRVRRNEAAAQETERLISQLAGVRSVQANPVTGSVTVQYDRERLTPVAILRLLEREGLFDPKQAMSHDQHLAHTSGRMGELVGKVVMSLAMDRALAGTGLSFLSALI